MHMVTSISVNPKYNLPGETCQPHQKDGYLIIKPIGLGYTHRQIPQIWTIYRVFVAVLPPEMVLKKINILLGNVLHLVLEQNLLVKKMLEFGRSTD